MSIYTNLRKEYLREWRLWYEMCYKCQHNKEYYVEVSVCDEWQGPDGFVQFIDDLGPRPSDNHYLSRKDKTGDWTPQNTEWVSSKSAASEGTAQTRRDEQYYHYKDLALSNGIQFHTFYNRLTRGWSLQDAATLPISQIKYKNRIF